MVLVMHGMNRNADDYRDQWHELAIKHDFLLIVPEFSRKNFPGSRGYNLGNMLDENDHPVSQALWTFSAIEPIFDDVRRKFSMQLNEYSIYGHSAGSQFVHRFLMHVPQARVRRAVVANAGWYTLPQFETEWPYGLKGTTVKEDALSHFLRLPVTVLLGMEDNDPNDDSLRRTSEAMMQGPHRLARGIYFFGMAFDLSKAMGQPFRWKLARVPGVNHDNAKMAPAAVQFLLED